MTDPSSITPATPHISVCVCTYKRPRYLAILLRALFKQKTDGRFTYSVAVADNDHLESGRPVVERLAAAAPIPISYDVEPRQNIALARNKVLEHATGDFVALIDDDEEPFPDWLLRLLEAIDEYNADGVLGPVIPRFETAPPRWAVRGRCFERPSLPTGTVLRWRQTRTASALLRRSVIDGPGGRFLPEFGHGGEDVDFFRRQIERGRRFVWCDEATVYEAVPKERCTRSYVLRRALHRGRHPFNQGRLVLWSFVALPAYAVVLPFLFITRHHRFMPYLISACDHFGRVMAFAGGKLWDRVLPPGRA